MKFLISTLLITIGLFSCAHKPRVTTPVKTEKEQESNLIDQNSINPATEKALGESIFSNLTQKYKLLVVSDDFKNYTVDIVKKLAENSNRPNVDYQVYISESKDFFAFGLPGGKIIISKSVFDAIKTESEYANVIANQMAHIAKQHLIHDLMQNMQYHNELLSGNVSERLTQQGIFSLTQLGYTVEKINEADRLAPVYAMHVGYDTQGLLRVLITVKDAMDKSRIEGITDLNKNWITHRTSMNEVFVKALEKADKAGFPKAEDRFAAMLKKIRPAPIKKKK